MKKYTYLLTGIIDQSIPSKEKFNTEEIVIGNIGIRLRKIFVVEDKKSKKGLYIEGEPRFAFTIGDGIKNDILAQKFADGVMLGIALVHETCLEDTPAAIAVQEKFINDKGFIKFSDIMEDEKIGSEIYFKFTNSIGIPKKSIDYVWHILPALFKYEYLLNAASFFKESIITVWVCDDDVFEIMADNTDLPISQAERARIETSYQNAFKSIEAIIGEPSKDKNKLKQQLTEQGINPNEIVGYVLYDMKPGKEGLLYKIQVMQRNRDKKAAHGKTDLKRNIGYCELKDKQALARYVILNTIEFRLKKME